MKEENNKTRIGKGAQGYGYKYTDLAQIHEYLEEQKVSYYQYIETDTMGNDYIMTVPIINGKQEAPRRGVKVVDAVLQGIKNPAQEQGSATTYARRYSLLMAFGLATEDDDGAKLTKPEGSAKKPKAKPTLATEKQIEVLEKNKDNETVKKALEYYKKDIKDLAVTEASTIIQKIMTKEEK